MPIKGGPEEAAKMLAGLPKEQRKKVLDELIAKDPQMAEVLKKLMVTLDDLQFITISMLQELLREIDIRDLALALRIAGDEVKNFILGNISKGMRQEMEEVLLGPPQPVNKVQEAEEKVMQVVRDKVDNGTLIIKRGGHSEEMV